MSTEHETDRPERTNQADSPDPSPQGDDEGTAGNDAVPAPEPELQDEPPGSYLRELGVRGWNVAAAAIVLTATIALGAAGRAALVPEEWLPPARVVWVLLPVVALGTFIITLWQHLSPFTPRVPGKAHAALWISLVATILWGVLDSAGAFGVD